MRVIDLFTGIGGFSLGLERAGMSTVAFCEVDKTCHRVLKKHFPTVPIHDDVRNFTGVEAEVVCGGFPCQDISIAGRQAGIQEGTRSGLWSEFKRIISEVKPKYAIIENVERLRAKGLVRVLNDLREIGYDAEWHTIPASALGAPHKRERIWIIAYPSGYTSGRVLDSKDVVPCDGQWEYAENIRSWHGWQYWLAKDVFDGNRVEDAPREDRVDDGLPSRVDRVRQLGNSVVPQIPELIGRAIMAKEASYL